MFDIPMNSKPAMSLDSLSMSSGQSAQPNFNQQPQQNFAQPAQPNFNQQPQQNFTQPAQPSFSQQPQQNFAQPAQPNFNQQPQQNFVQPVQQPVAKPSGGGVILKKGQKTSLSQMNPSLNNVRIGLGWDVGANTNYDLDSEIFLLGANDKVIGDDWFVFYGQLTSPDGAVVHYGDNKTGIGEGDDEIIDINLTKLNPQVAKIVFVVTINEAKENGYNFGQIKNAYIRIIDNSSSKELVRFDLTEYYKEVVSMVVGELYLKNGEWRFNPVGMGTGDDLEGLCVKYGVNVAG